MKDVARYHKVVEWSEEDQCFVGRAPDLMLGGCHGSDERAVFEELCQIVEEWIETYRKDGESRFHLLPGLIRRTPLIPKSELLRRRVQTFLNGRSIAVRIPEEFALPVRGDTVYLLSIKQLSFRLDGALAVVGIP